MSKIRVLGETRGPKHEVEKVVHDHLYAKLLDDPLHEVSSSHAVLVPSDAQEDSWRLAREAS